MVNPEIEEYLSAGLRRGIDLEEIRQQLLARGFSDMDINEVVLKLNPEENKEDSEGSTESEEVDDFADNLE